MHNGFTTENYGKYGYAGTKKITIVQTPTGGQQVSITLDRLWLAVGALDPASHPGAPIHGETTDIAATNTVVAAGVTTKLAHTGGVQLGPVRRGLTA